MSNHPGQTDAPATELDRATTHTRFVADQATDNGTDNGTGWAIRTNTLDAQTRALRSMAAFLERLDIAGLSLTFDEERVTIQIGERADHACLATTAGRIRALRQLAAALGSVCWHKPSAAGGAWLITDGHVAGHPVHAFTRLDHHGPSSWTDEQELHS